MTSPIILPYSNGGTGKVYDISNFFTRTIISGCDLVCNYGDSCGAATIISAGTHVSVTNAADSWQITAKENEILGYS